MIRECCRILAEQHGGEVPQDTRGPDLTSRDWPKDSQRGAGDGLTACPRVSWSIPTWNAFSRRLGLCREKNRDRSMGTDGTGSRKSGSFSAINDPPWHRCCTAPKAQMCETCVLADLCPKVGVKQ